MELIRVVILCYKKSIKDHLEYAVEQLQNKTTNNLMHKIKI